MGEPHACAGKDSANEDEILRYSVPQHFLFLYNPRG